MLINFWGQNPNNLNIRDSHIEENSISLVFTPYFCILIQHSLICDRYSWWLFLTENRRRWRRWNVIFFFLKSNRIWHFFGQGVKLMSDKVPTESLVLMLRCVVSYREYSRWGRLCPSGARVIALEVEKSGWIICPTSQLAPLSPTLVRLLHKATSSCKK